jgi:methionyl-tRNA formyltransferase
MEAGLDTGPVAATARVAIGEDMTTGELHDALAVAGAELMVRSLRDLAAGALAFTPQAEEGVTYAQKIDKSESRIDWRRPARAIHDLVRGLSPFPGAFFESDLGHGLERVKVLRTKLEAGEGAPGAALDDKGLVACGEGALRLMEVQRGGKAPMAIAEFLRGRPLAPGMTLAT